MRDEEGCIGEIGVDNNIERIVYAYRIEQAKNILYSRYLERFYLTNGVENPREIRISE